MNGTFLSVPLSYIYIFISVRLCLQPTCAHFVSCLLQIFWVINSSSIAMNCSFTSSLSNAKPFLSHATTASHKPRRKPVSTAFACRASSGNDQSSNLYKVLSLNSNQASIDEIKKAYRIMARQYHPDVCHPSKKDESTRMFVQLHEAYKTLSDPVSREDYDCRLSSRNFEGTFRADFTDQRSRTRWQEQIQGLKRRSNYKMAQKERSWGMQ